MFLSQQEQARIELGLTQAETVSLELGLIRAGLENIIWSQKKLVPKSFVSKNAGPQKMLNPKSFHFQ